MVSTDVTAPDSDPFGTLGLDALPQEVEAVSFCQDEIDGTPCDDGLPCTIDDQCDGGLCLGAQHTICDAEGPCRMGVCDDNGACVYSDVEDDSPCGVACFQEASCQAGECKATPGTEQPCESPDNPCVDELKCDPSTGACTVEIVALEGTVCDTDEDVCSLESCNAEGACIDSDVTNTCELEASSNPCWTYVCSPAKGCLKSQFVVGTSCNDGNACTSNDSCIEDELGLKVCKGSPLLIDDLNPCTDDTCVEGVIAHTALDGAICPIEHPCSELGQCVEDSCEPQQECECSVDADCGAAEDPCLGPMICDTTGAFPKCMQDTEKPVACPPSGDPCQINACQSDSGSCSLEPELDGTACDDDSACTSDEACFSGVCGNGSVVDCDNGNVCDGLEVCDAKLGCVEGIPLACDDSNACNGQETCHVLQGCVSGSPLSCDDGNVCNGVEVCDGAIGCVAGSSLACDDDVYCNGAETCHPVDGCQTGQAPLVDDGIDCTIDTCDEASNSVKHSPFNKACGEGNPCTSGLCDPLNGCSLVNMPNDTPCPGGTCLLGECTCTPECAPGSCGDDGCGGFCKCSDGLACVNEVCEGQQDDPWTGTWTVTANPNTQSLGGLGSASFIPTDLVLVVDGVSASGTVNNGGQVVQYTGTATDSTLSLSASFTDAAGILHQETWSLTLVDPTKAEGVMDENLSVFGFPFALTWNVTAVKKQ
jgi:hypothetical protein